MALVTQHVLTPVGGRLAHFVENCQEISSDPWVLETVTGSTIDFHATPIQYKPPAELVVDAAKTEIVSREVRELSAKKATIRAPRDSEGFSSSLFLVPNANGSWRPVLNLKPFVASQRFKMESAQTVKNRETI